MISQPIGGVLATGDTVRLRANTGSSTDQTSAVIKFTMPADSVKGYIAIQDQLGNLYDMREIDIELEGAWLSNLLPLAIVGGIAVIAGVAISRRKKRKTKST